MGGGGGSSLRAPQPPMQALQDPCALTNHGAATRPRRRRHFVNSLIRREATASAVAPSWAADRQVATPEQPATSDRVGTEAGI